MKRGGRAIQALERAAHLRSRDANRPHERLLYEAEAARHEAAAEELLQPGELVSSHGEAVSRVAGETDITGTMMVNTLENPTMIGVNASEQRMRLAAELDILEAAADAAETIQAGNSVERMLAHQMTACHCMAMKCLYRAQEQKQPVEAARLANVAVRLMDTFREGYVALHRVRNAGKQTVVVQHVNVNGGQAVVTGEIKGGTHGGD